MSFRSPPPIATACTTIALAILVGLGWWQVQRMHWKEQLLAELEQEYAKNADKIQLDRGDIHAVASGEAMLRRGSITGRYLHAHEMQLRASYYKGESGIDILTPFQLKGYRTLVLVNRGWTPPDRAAPDKRPKSRVRGTMSITGTLKRPQTHLIGTPRNNADQGEWYYPAPERMAEAQGLDHLAPVVFEVEREPVPGQYPRTSHKRPEPHNRHLSYAIFWFSMAGALLVVYYLRFIRRAGD